MYFFEKKHILNVGSVHHLGRNCQDWMFCSGNSCDNEVVLLRWNMDIVGVSTVHAEVRGEV